MAEDQVTNYTTEDGKCSNCGKCCSNCLPLSDDEVRKIHRYIQQNHIREQRHNAAAGVDMTCPFRDEAHKRCLIYPVRPEICRKFICNQTEDVMLRNKENAHKKNHVIFMRYEFFKNAEDVAWFSQAIGGILENDFKYRSRRDKTSF